MSESFGGRAIPASYPSHWCHGDILASYPSHIRVVGCRAISTRLGYISESLGSGDILASHPSDIRVISESSESSGGSGEPAGDGLVGEEEDRGVGHHPADGGGLDE